MRQKQLLLAVVTALQLVAGASLSGPVEDGSAAFERRDYATAMRLWRGPADRGDARAQAHIGTLYMMGYGVQQDFELALRWFSLAANRGDAEAQNNLGVLLEEGRGVSRDLVAALSWYRKSARQGNPVAQNNMGLMHRDGLGTPRNYVMAHMWFNLAAGNSDQEDAASRARNRDAIARYMSATEIQDAQARARRCRASQYQDCD